MFRTISITCIAIACVFTISHFTYAQNVAGTDQSLIAITSDPTFAQPNTPIILTIESSALDLNRSTISWYIDGVLQKDTGKTLVVIAGPTGSSKTVRVVVVAPDGRVGDKQITLAPQSITLIWQANTYTPPFYKGRTLFGNGADLAIQAIPGTNSYNANNLIYTWRKNGTIIADTGGLGANRVVIKNQGEVRPVVVSVEVESSDRMYRAETFVEITPTFPAVRIYENDPLLGIRFEKALSARDTLPRNETGIEVFPYFFSTTNRFLSDLSTTWKINGSTVLTAQDKNSVILQKSEGIRSASVEVLIRNKAKALQLSGASFNLQFPQ